MTSISKHIAKHIANRRAAVARHVFGAWPDLPAVSGLRAWIRGVQDLRAHRAERRAVTSPAPLATRLRERKIARAMAVQAALEAAVLPAYERCSYRRAEGKWAGGDHVVRISVGIPAASGRSDRVWSSNGKWSGLDSAHQITVPANWAATVHVAGIAVVDDKLVLAYDAATGAATWVEQARGFDLRVEHGSIRDGKLSRRAPR